MPDNKLTDNEIIKALECCSEANNCGQCEYEPTEYQIGTVGCCNELMKDALNLINRLQAENERLKREIEDLESMQEISPEAKYLVDTKADKVISLLNEINKSQEQIKAEAYKEFAERLKEKLFEPVETWLESNIVRECDIDNLLKELVGEDK